MTQVAHVIHVTQVRQGIQNISLLFEATSECSESGGRAGARVDDFLLWENWLKHCIKIMLASHLGRLPALSADNLLDERKTDRRELRSLLLRCRLSGTDSPWESLSLAKEASSHSCWSPCLGRVPPPRYSRATKPKSFSTVMEVGRPGLSMER